MAADEEVIGTAVVEVAADYEEFDRAMRQVRRSTEDAGTWFERTFTNNIRFGMRVAATAITGGVAVFIARLNGWRGSLARTLVSVRELVAVTALLGGKVMKEAADRMRDVNGELTTMGKVAYATGVAVEGLAKIWLTITGILTGLRVAGGLATAVFIHQAKRLADEVAPAWNQVLTVLEDAGGDGGGFFNLKQQVNEVAIATGTDLKEAMAVLYEIFGAMPQLLERPERALGLLRESLEVGTTGFGTAMEAASLATGIINAFGLEVEESTDIMDKFWAAQGAGKFEFGEVAREAGAAAASISAVGGSYEDMLAILAVTTPLNIPVPEAVTQIQSALNAIIGATPQARDAARELGIEFGVQEIRAKGLAESLRDIIDATEGRPELLRRLFPDRRGLDLMIQLSARSEELTERIREVDEAAGTHARTVARMGDSYEAQRQILSQQIPGFLRQLGFEFESLGVKALRAINGVLFALRGLDEEGRRMATAPNAWSMMADQALAEQQRVLAGMEMLREAQANRQREAAQRLLSAGMGEGEGLFGSRAWSELLKPPPKGSLADRLFTPEAQFPEMPREPIDLEYVEQKINDRAAALEALNIAQLAATGDLEAYEAAARRAQEEVNELVIAEAKRIRIAGAQETTINQVLAMYQVLGRASDQVDRAMEAARRRLADQAAAWDALAPLRDLLGGPPAPTVPDTLQGSLERILELDRQIAAIEEDIRVSRQEAPAQVRELIAALEREREIVSERVVRIRAEWEGLDEFEAEVTNVVTIIGRMFQGADGRWRSIGGAIDGIADATRRAREAQDELIRARISGDGVRLREAIEEEAEAQEQAVEATQRALRDYEAALASGAISQDQFNDLLNRMVELLRSVGIELEVSTGSHRDWEDIAASIEAVARGVLSAADAMGVLKGQQRQVLEGFVNIAAAAGRIATGDWVGGVVQGLGGLAGVLKGVFGSSPEDVARLERHRSAMKDLEVALLDLRDAYLGSVSETQLRADREFAVEFPDELQAWFEGVGRLLTNTGQAQGYLAQALGYESAAALERELRDLTDRYGVDLMALWEAGDWQGLRRAVASLPEEIDYQLAQLGRFSEDVAGRIEAVNFQFRVLDNNDPVDRLRAYNEAFAEAGINAGDFQAQLEELARLDLSTEEGRAERDRIVREMAERLSAGGAAIGDFTVAQLREIIEEWARAAPREDAEEPDRRVAETLARVRFELDALGESDAAVRVRALVAALREAGVDLGEFADEFAALDELDLDTEAGREAMAEIIRAMTERMRDEDVDLGTLTQDEMRQLILDYSRAGGEVVGDVVAETFARLRFELDTLGVDGAAERVRALVRALEAAGVAFGEFGDELAEMQELDLSTVSGRERLDELVAGIVERLAARDVDLGGMTLEQWRSLVGDWARASGEAAGETVSRGVDRSVTETTMRREVSLLTSIAHWAQEAVELLGRLAEQGDAEAARAARGSAEGRSLAVADARSVPGIGVAAAPLARLATQGVALLPQALPPGVGPGALRPPAELARAGAPTHVEVRFDVHAGDVHLPVQSVEAVSPEEAARLSAMVTTRQAEALDRLLAERARELERALGNNGGRR